MSTVVERIAEIVKGVGVTSAYGEPTELNGIHIVPVALTVHGFGGGEGRGNGGAGRESDQQVSGEGEGSGGGGFAASIPLGAYVRDIRGLRFEANPIALLVVATPFVAACGAAFAQLAWARKRRK
ncbi:MAG: hypothetical protein FWD85_08130 [Microbacteriaceae bacterium]|nr:hypothetical protein [Microbacteriaceae bacterium]MCL2795258.1 hypothetical protein [Microbacteriaceae bacterium]